MKIDQIADLLHANMLVDANLQDAEFTSACGADLMSDVLAFVKQDAMLLTGLINPHVVRTAEMLDIQLIIFVRGKVPPEEVLEVARELGITVLCTKLTMFAACGILYNNGVRGSGEC